MILPADAAALADLEPFERTEHRRPLIPPTPEALYAFGSLIRECELSILDLCKQNLVSGTTHTCLGQEFCQMAVVRALTRPADSVWSTHRNHGHFLTYSGDVAALLGEVLGREAGVCGGLGGSQHLMAPGFHSSGVQAGLTAIAVGEALSRKRRGEDGLAAVFIGDGTLGQGLVYESLNLAAVWAVPVLFVVENNRIAQSTPTADTTAGEIRARGEAFGLPTWHINDAAADFFERAEHIVAEVRNSARPGFLVIDTQRLGPHSKGDDTRDAQELAAIRQRDPLGRLGERLPPATRQRLDEANRAFFALALTAACASPPARYRVPPRHTFTRHRPVSDSAEPRYGGATVRQSLNAALRRLLDADPAVLLLGEDLRDPYGGAFKVTEGLSSVHPDRVIAAPISEAAVVGAGIGLALTSSRPIVEIMFADFLTLAFDQLLNQAVKLAALSPQWAAPLVVRTATGGRRGYGPTHSQSLESLAAAIPGLTVIVAHHRYDPGTLLERAVQSWPYPTVFFEPKLSYGLACDAASYTVAPSDPRDPGGELFPLVTRGREGADITLVTCGGMLPTVEAVAARLEQEEVSVRTVVLSLIAPLPRHTLLSLVSSAPRLLIVEEAHGAHGLSAEVAAALLENDYRGQFRRIATPPVPLPAARSLEMEVIPGEDVIFDEICRFMGMPSAAVAC